MVNVSIVQLSDLAVIPEYKTEGASGFDLHSTVDVTLLAGETKTVSLDLAFEIPMGYEMQIRPRSGLSAKTKLRVSNSPATIDADFRGNVCVILDNIGSTAIDIKIGDRIAQGVLAEVPKANFTVVKKLSETTRGEGGLGSTGV